MATDRRKGERVTFERGFAAHMMGSDGIGRRSCVVEDISETGAKLVARAGLIHEFRELGAMPEVDGVRRHGTSWSRQ